MSAFHLIRLSLGDDIRACSDAYKHLFLGTGAGIIVVLAVLDPEAQIALR